MLLVHQGRIVTCGRTLVGVYLLFRVSFVFRGSTFSRKYLTLIKALPYRESSPIAWIDGMNVILLELSSTAQFDRLLIKYIM